jgi:methylenetetrahydrofolate dehydrogenase (NADP+)/methenyltetrahydrofolate cyclohydrolase
MLIDGRAIAKKILDRLEEEIRNQKLKGINPTFAVILIGEDPASQAYVNRKQKSASQIGIVCQVHKLPSDTKENKILELIGKLNSDKDVHGVIIQRPLPPQISAQKVGERVNPQKDIDGFHPQTKFIPPIAEAVNEILKSVNVDPKNKKVVVIGRGETAGLPIANILIQKGAIATVVHSKTRNIPFFTKKADIVISCVGKPNIVTTEMINNNTVLIGVGLHRESDGKLHGDYNEEKIARVVKYYTPTPGGIGPVNVACLLKNVIIATQNQYSYIDI